MLCGRVRSIFYWQSSHKIQKPWNLSQHVRSYRNQKFTSSKWSFSTSKHSWKGGGKKPTTPLTEVIGEETPAARRLWKPFAFTIVFSGSSFAGAAIWQYENMRVRAEKLFKQQATWMHDKLKNSWKKYEWRHDLNRWWNDQTEAQKMFCPILFINCLVFLAWKIPRFQGTMLKYFCSNPASSVVCWPMILSVFSHYSVFHLFCNMYVLHSVSPAIVSILGKEQFFGLYLSSGVISSFASHLYKVASGRIGYSLGASGAILTMLAMFCTQFPDSKLSIIFLPMFTFTAGMAIKSIIMLDTAGVILKWKVFDHAAHLGGAVFGIVWCHWGNKYIWQKREPFMIWWHELRGAGKPR